MVLMCTEVEWVSRMFVVYAKRTRIITLRAAMLAYDGCVVRTARASWPCWR